MSTTLTIPTDIATPNNATSKTTTSRALLPKVGSRCDQAGRPADMRRGLIGRMRTDQRGEGVISAAIAVLIMAFVGVAAFVAYRGIMSSVTAKTTECVNVYVSNGSGCQ